MSAHASYLANQRLITTAAAAALAALLMFGFGYAMVPLYYKICAALGIPTARDAYVTQWSIENAGRELRAEFDTNSHSERLAMIPLQQIVPMRTGVAYSVTYELRNLTDQTLRGRAVPSYSPMRAAQWVVKLQCFCFDDVELAPHETRKVPVVLTVEEDMPEDIGVFALSYTFYDLGAPQATLDHDGSSAH